MIKSSKEALSRLDFVDSIRGLAAFYVVTYHLVLIPNPSLSLPYLISSFILHGDTGVTLFFIASAFTLAYSMNQRESEIHTTRRFYIRRIFRILPLFYFWLILFIVRNAISFKVTYSLLHILINSFFLFNFIPGMSEGIVWASWTLGIEMIFYLFFPLIFKYVKGFWRSIGFLLIMMVVSMIWSQNLTHYVPNIGDTYIIFSFLYRLPCFAFGLVVFYIYQEISRKDIYSPSIAFALLAASALGYYGLISGKFSNLVLDELYWEALFCSLFVLGLAFFSFQVFVNRTTKFLGEISYSLYLNHPSIIFYLIPVFRYFYGLSIPTVAQYFLSLSSVTILLIIISTLTYKYIEKPGMRLGNKIIKSQKLSIGWFRKKGMEEEKA